MATILASRLQQRQSPMNVLCASSSAASSSSSQLCRQGALPGGPVTNVRCLKVGNRSQVPYFLKSKQGRRVRATARANLQAALAEDAAETVTVPEILSSSEVISTEADLPEIKFVDTPEVSTKIEVGPLSGQEGGIADVEPSSALTSGDLPSASPSGEVDLSLLDGADASTSTSLPAVDALQSAGGEAGSTNKAALSAQEEYLRLTGGGNQGAEQAQTDDFGDSLKAAQDIFGDSLKAAGKSLDDVVNAVRASVDSAGSSVKSVYDSANGSLLRAVKSVTAPLDNSVNELKSEVDNVSQGVSVDFTSLFRAGTPANDALKDVVTVAKSATGSALQAAGSLTSQAYSITKNNVPSEVQSFLDSAEEKVAQITGPVGSAIDQAYVIITNAERAAGLNPDNPIIPVVLVVGGSLYLGFSFLKVRYGGYSGDLPPSVALDVLKNENAVLVDIRSQETRQGEGIPDLRRSTRSKFAAIEIVKVDGAIRGAVKKSSEVESLLTATVIRNLKNVNGGSTIIVLDADGSQSKQIARGLKKSGAKRAYRVDGGFKAWISSGLRVKADVPQTALTVLQEDAEALVEEVQPTTAGISAVVLGSVAGVYALYEWEKTLQLIGVLGIAASVYSRVSEYATVEDAKADLKVLQKPFAVAIQAVVWIGGLIEPKKLQLATSPVSSNVQGRVIQAAAKHGANPPELELVQGEPGEEKPDEIAPGEQDGEDAVTQSQHTNVEDPE